MENNQNRKIWLNGSIVSVIDAKINVLSPSFQYGANVFEGIRAYWNDSKKQLFAFRLKDHFDRLIDSIKLFHFSSNFTISDFKDAFISSIIANNYKEDIAIRQTVFLDGFGNWSSLSPLGMFVNPFPQGRSIPNGRKGINCSISSYERINEKNLSPRIKVGANYINSRYGLIEARQNGYDSTIFLNNEGKVSEGPGACVFIIKNNKLITPSLSESILDSITRKSIIDISKNILMIPVEERRIDRTEIYTADSVFFVGTSVEILPIIKVDSFNINGGAIHPILSTLIENYFNIARGESYLNYNWISPIY
jgi:branched-chain amino acid aminotransferase